MLLQLLSINLSTKSATCGSVMPNWNRSRSAEVTGYGTLLACGLLFDFVLAPVKQGSFESKLATLTFLHNFNEVNDRISPLPDCKESSLCKRPKLCELWRPHSTKYIQVVLRKFKRHKLKPDRAGRVVQHESKINMCNVSLMINQDIAVMSIFDLQ
jgi:hypothetical protein